MKEAVYKFFRKIKYTFFRNSFMMDGKLAKKNQVNLEYWRGIKNLGDTLSPVIVDWMLKKKNISQNKKVKKTKHFIALGSIMDNGHYDCVVWGTGVNTFEGVKTITLQSKHRKYDIRSVRGPFTAQAMEDMGYSCPKIYGDPGVLMPLIYYPKVEKKYKVSVIQHYRKQEQLPNECHGIEIKTDDYEFFIKEILASEKVISSSLHGIILAESYGVPAVFVTNGVEKELLKYYDWYYSTKRQSVIVTNSIEQALEVTPMKLPENIKELQQNLICTFPYDMWEG